MNGYQAEIYESHNLPGGLCTSWKRKGYTIDGSCHWVIGSGPGSSFHKVWEELGALQDRTFVNYEYYARFRDTNGRELILYTDVDRLEKHMKELSPQDAVPTEELCGLIRKFQGFGMPAGKPPQLMGPLDGIRMLLKMRPFMKIFAQGESFTAAKFAARFKDPLIRDAIQNALFGASMSLFPLVMTMADMGKGAAGYPLGGSLEFARSIEKRFLSLGGTVHYGARVKKIVERDGKATGIQLADGGPGGGTVVDADWVISACDMRHTLTGLLDGTRMEPAHRELFEKGVTIDPAIQVTFGVSRDFSGAEPGFTEAFRLAEPVCIGGRTVEWFNAKVYAFDPAMAPAGKTVMMSMFLSDWGYWEKMKDNPIHYKEEKERIAQVCIRALETRYPGIGSQIEVTDVVTPLTYVRYTGNWKGSYMTWLVSGEFRKKYRFIPKTVPGLDSFSMASMWTDAPGGLPGAASAGRGVVQLLCARDRKRFVTTTA
jgi:phytoene dehydrogenase-like protein